MGLQTIRRGEMGKCEGSCGESNTKEKINPLKTTKTLIVEEDIFEEIYKERMTDVAEIELDSKFDWVVRKRDDKLVLVPLKKEE